MPEPASIGGFDEPQRLPEVGVGLSVSRRQEALGTGYRKSREVHRRSHAVPVSVPIDRDEPVMRGQQESAVLHIHADAVHMRNRQRLGVESTAGQRQQSN